MLSAKLNNDLDDIFKKNKVESKKVNPRVNDGLDNERVKELEK